MKSEHLPTRLGTESRNGGGFLPHPGSHVSEYSHLSVQVLTPETSRNTCGPYLYAVQWRGMAFTAFRTRANFLQWLENLALKLDGELGPEGEGHWVPISGTYRETSHSSYDEFYLLEGKRIRHLDNADYTLGILMHDDDGVVNIHYLNCNLRDRPVFEAAASWKLVG